MWYDRLKAYRNIWFMASFIPPLYIGTSWRTYYILPETMDVGISNEIGERNSMQNEAYV